MKKLILLLFISFLSQGCFMTYLPNYDGHRHRILRRNVIPYHYYRQHRNRYNDKRW